MDGLDAALLGLVQGLTEFLPISSTAHLLVAQEWLGVNPPGLQFEVAVHLGTVLAVVVYYRRLFGELAVDVVRGGPGRKLVAYVAVATAMLGVALLVYRAFPQVKQWREQLAMTPLGLVPVGLFMIASAWAPRGTREPSVATSVAMGLAQCAAAVVPGCSRSGSTIGTGLFLGLDPATAARFSFLMSVPAVLAATAKDVRDEGLPDAATWGPLLVAGAVAFASGLLAIHWMLTIVGRGKLHRFGPYCVALGIAVWWVTRR